MAAGQRTAAIFQSLIAFCQMQLTSKKGGLFIVKTSLTARQCVRMLSIRHVDIAKCTAFMIYYLEDAIIFLAMITSGLHVHK